MKKHKIIFWLTVVIIFLFEGVLTAFTFRTELAREGVSHLGYPLYFGNLLVVFKVLGALALIIPAVPARIKEWAFAGFGFVFLSALVSLWVVDGFGVMLLMPLVFMGILAVCYNSYHKLLSAKV